jgi:tRNA nucleotidyltransferase (CCA-adding enzyme)
VLAVPEDSRPLLERLGRAAHKLGARSFLVGGPVRDILLGRTGPDTDVAVDRKAEEFGRALERELGGRFTYHSRFLTGTVALADGGHIDISSTRTETYERPAVLPRVKPAAIEADLARRDFSINAMALELSPGAFGRLIDPLGGQADIAARTVRVLHEESFTDDPTRIFRAIRFATRFEFAIEPRTLELMRAALRERLPSKLTPERVLYELQLVCAEPLILPALEALLKERVLQSTWDWRPRPGLLVGMRKLVQSGAGAGLRFVYLLGFLPVTDRWPLRKEDRLAAAAIGSADALRDGLARARRPSAVHRLLHPVPRPALEVLSRIEPAPAARRIRAYLDTMADARPDLSGADLKALGLRPGPLYTRVLDKLLWARLDGSVTDRAGELALCRRLIRSAK